MKKCPCCDYSNYDYATVCRKCDNPFVLPTSTVYHGKTYWMGPERGKAMRSRALCLIVLGLLIKVYWGGYGPWPIIDLPILVTLRPFLEPILLYGGAAFYAFGWIASFI